ncbi:hypothetical protein MNEG_2720 [Monoraphidium neglectum]|uniref:Uncharacterized protein n=1 Tax=Monoraphidium neglectum TaxID=145388 RepID=A0A0D2MRL7_9CHLO|nr:hypothetical protein MNEG_2720 [Monoraphidium neglectum]KIZ05240.1 hypothetical protein MNEG_2720 [Monoraphidium neglectum]|eukprot:XP_013904259.1 hypothetical protein MNEG_2720 [Monoraphidium neglectum]
MGPCRSPSPPILDAYLAPSFAPSARPGAGPAAPSLRRSGPGVGAQRLGRARMVAVRAADKGALAALRDDVARFVARYDPVATGLGSLSLCGYCMVVHGQSAAEALQMSALATVLGMVGAR